MASERTGDLAEILHRFRAAAGLTQEELAERARLSARAISDLERGARTRPHVSTLRQLSDALQLGAEDRQALQQAARTSRTWQPAASVADAIGRGDAPFQPLGQRKENRQRLPTGGFLGSLSTGQLVARERELTRLNDIVETVVAGQGQLVLLVGEPGVGKTRLAQELTRAVYEREFLLAAGRCYEPHQNVPFYPFLEALHTTYIACPASIRDQVPHRWPYLARLIPEELGHAPAPTNEAEDQERLFRSLGAFVQTVAQARPIAILLDDLHWADRTSLRLLHHLARQTRGTRVLLLGAYRDVEVQSEDPLESTLLDLQREQLVERIPLGRLDPSGTAAIITQTLGEVESAEEFAGLVHGFTDGNPFFTQQVLRTLIETGTLHRAEGRWSRRAFTEIDVPGSVRSVIRQRFSRLDSEVQEILQEASVLGAAFAFEDLVAMRSLTETRANAGESIDATLTEAASFGLVRKTENGRYAFDHSLTQRALYTSLPPYRLSLLHDAAGRAIEERTARTQQTDRAGRAAEVAWHYLNGPDTEKALRYSLLAGDQAASVFAYGDAERQYRAAMELALKVGDLSREREALEKLGAMLRRLGRYEEALDFLERAVQISRGVKDLEGEVRATVEIAHARVGQGQEEEVIDRVQALVDSPEVNASSRELGRLYAVLAYMLFAHGKYHDQLEAATRAAHVARSVKDTRLLAAAEERWGTALLMLGRHQDARPHLEEAIRLAEAVNDLDVLNLCLTNLGDLCLTEGRFEHAKRYWRKALDVAERLGEPWVLGFDLSNLSQVLYLIGEWDAASAQAGRALEAFRTSAVAWYAAYPLLHLGTLALAQGDQESGTRQLEECIAIASSRGDLQAERYAQLALAEHDLLEERPGSTLARLEPLLDRPGFQEGNVSRLLACVAWAHLEMNDVAQAEKVLQDAMERAATQRDMLARVELLLVQGKVLSRRRKWEEAGRAFEEAASLAKRMPYPLAEARAICERGVMLARRGERLHARQLLEEALPLFRRLGARPYIERTVKALIEAR